MIDQISGLIDTLRTDPDSRRMLVSAWNVSELGSMALAPVTPSSSAMRPKAA